MGARLTLLGSWTSALVGVGALAWAWRIAAEPLPVWTERRIEGAPIDRGIIGSGVSGARRSAQSSARDDQPLAELEALDGFFPLDLESLAFDDYDPPELRGGSKAAFGVEDFPPAIARYHDRDVELVGFPLVTGFADGETTGLLITRFPPGCCFGSVPVLDEWVAVDLAEGKVDAGTGFDPVSLRGRFLVGELLDEHGFVQSLYRLKDARPLP